MQSAAKFIFVTGGVMSGLGKGVTTSSIAKLLQLADQRVSCVKIDPYLNYDAGTMNPVAHGEVFVTEDGGECDMDIGNYERFLNQNIPKSHNITTAQVYASVIDAERRGEYLGACVQIIPHITDEIKRRIRAIAYGEDGAGGFGDSDGGSGNGNGNDSKPRFLIVECGGTVGDIESLPFLEALRQMRIEEGPHNVLFVHVTLAPELDVVGEQKTKPTQHSVQELRRIGIQPDFIAARCTSPLGEKIKQKIAMFTNVTPQDVLSCHDAESILQVPQMLHEQGIMDSIYTKFGIFGMLNTYSNWDRWNAIVKSMAHPGKDPISIAMVGKYVTLADSYVSVNHALKHAGASISRPVNIDWIDSESITDCGMLSNYDGILVPGGFGTRGSEGIMDTATYARQNDIPYLGICFGFQLAAIAFGRSVLGLEGANSTEIDPDTPHPVVDLLPEQKGVSEMGGSLRLGSNAISISEGTMARKVYGGAAQISKRHRHRYEINAEFIPALRDKGAIFSAESDAGRRMEIMEIPSHRFYMGVQFHPEFNSRPGFPEESFAAFVGAAAGRADGRAGSAAGGGAA